MTSLGKAYLNRSRVVDPILGLILAVVVLLAPRYPEISVAVQAFFDGKRASLYAAVASIAGSLLGFAIAAVTIVLTAAQAPGLQIVRESRHYGELWKQFHSAIWWLFGATVCAVLGIALDSEAAKHITVTAIVSGITLTAGLRVFNAIWILEQIILLATKK